MVGSSTSLGNYSWISLCNGQYSVLHPQSRPWPAKAHWERHVGRGHGEKGQEAR